MLKVRAKLMRKLYREEDKKVNNIEQEQNSNMSVQEIKDYNETISKCSNKLVDRLDNLCVKTQEIDYSIQEVSKAAEEQTESIENSFIKTKELGGILEDLKGCTYSMHESLDNINKASEINENSVKILTERFDSIKKAIDNMTLAMNSLKNESKSISNVSTAIRKLSKQIDLISLNAMIEAARADNSGFMVVATEIQTLAKKAINESDGISDMLANVNDRVSESLNFFEQLRLAIEGEEKAVIQMEESIKNIDIQREKLNEDNAKLNSTTSLMNKTKDDFVDYMMNLSSLAEESLQSMRSVFDSINIMFSDTEKSAVLSEQLKDASIELDKCIYKYINK